MITWELYKGIRAVKKTSYITVDLIKLSSPSPHGSILIFDFLLTDNTSTRE